MRNKVSNPVLANSSLGFRQTTNYGGLSGVGERLNTDGNFKVDALSQTTSAYVGKRSVPKSYRVSSAKSKTVGKISEKAKTYYPEDYYKRVGYEKESDAGNDSRVDALGQRVRDRFNEDL